MSNSANEQIERILGRRLEAAQQGSLNNLNAISPQLIEEARKLPIIMSHLFLRHYLDSSLHKYLPNFVEDVVIGGNDPTKWRCGRVLVPLFSVDEMLTNDMAAIIAPLQPKPDEGWRRLRPNWNHWAAGEFINGAPAVLRPELDYTYIAPGHVMDLTLNSLEELEPINDVVIATRRWIASNIARTSFSSRIQTTSMDPLKFIVSAFPNVTNVTNVTNDALIAVRALLAEERRLEKTDPRVPGFRGPDEWYMGDIPE